MKFLLEKTLSVSEVELVSCASSEREIVKELKTFSTLLREQILACCDGRHAAFVVNQYLHDLIKALDVAEEKRNAVLSALLAHNISYVKNQYGYLLDAEEAKITYRNRNKIQLNFSVAQLGLIIRLAIELNMIPGNNHAGTIRQVAEIFSTLKREVISAESLYGKFYKHDEATREAVKAVLISMINKINSLPR